MIKIEFKSKTSTGDEVSLFKYLNKTQLDDFEYFTSKSDHYVDKVTQYIPTNDIWLDREHILTKLGITKEQDEANQREWRKLT